MFDVTHISRPELQAIPQLQAKWTFLYLEHCKLNRDQNAITITDKDGVVYLPAACINALLLGPGTSITHQAIMLIADVGITVVWVGEKGVRYYASGRPLTRSSSLLMKQATLSSNMRSHLHVARKMYQKRFPNEDVSKLTMQQLRGREGSRIRQVYRGSAKLWNVKWNGRDYRPDDYNAGDDVNKALSAGNACLYGLSHAVIAALGCSPGLGFIHVGHENSFVYDLADLYKAEICIPLAFEIASDHPEDVGTVMRHRIRELMVKARLPERMISDIYDLMSGGQREDDQTQIDAVLLWNGAEDLVMNGFNYGNYDGVVDDSDVDFG